MKAAKTGEILHVASLAAAGLFLAFVALELI